MLPTFYKEYSGKMSGHNGMFANILLSDEQITAVREQIGVQKLICITIDRTVDALARLTGGWP